MPNTIKIFTCGPSPMMKSVARFAIDNNIECDLALETIMACGIGICQGCTIVKKTNKKPKHMSTSCVLCWCFFILFL